MEEAGVSYRALTPIVPVIWLRRATIARAAEFVGADWSEIARAPRRTGAPDAGGGQEQDGDLAQSGGSGLQPNELGLAPASTEARNGSDRRRRDAWLTLTGLGLCLLITLLLASSLGHEPASPALNVSRAAGNAVGAPSYGDNARARHSSQTGGSRAGARGDRSGGGRAALSGTPAPVPPGSPPSATSKVGGSGSNRPAQGGLRSSTGSGSHRSPGPRSGNSPSRKSGTPTTPGPGSTGGGGSGGGSAENPSNPGSGSPTGSAPGSSTGSSPPPGPSPSPGPIPPPGPVPPPGPSPPPVPGRPPGA
jgi:hypothetical protein